MPADPQTVQDHTAHHEHSAGTPHARQGHAGDAPTTTTTYTEPGDHQGTTRTRRPGNQEESPRKPVGDQTTSGKTAGIAALNARALRSRNSDLPDEVSGSKCLALGFRGLGYE